MTQVFKPCKSHVQYRVHTTAESRQSHIMHYITDLSQHLRYQTSHAGAMNEEDVT